jgi:hypothetical protein
MCRNNTPEYTHLTFSQWRALRDEQLSQASGVPGGVFVHANGFIGGHATRCVADLRVGGKRVTWLLMVRRQGGRAAYGGAGGGHVGKFIFSTLQISERVKKGSQANNPCLRVRRSQRRCS